jgi:hypothetical protein
MAAPFPKIALPQQRHEHTTTIRGRRPDNLGTCAPTACGRSTCRAGSATSGEDASSAPMYMTDASRAAVEEARQVTEAFIATKQAIGDGLVFDELAAYKPEFRYSNRSIQDAAYREYCDDLSNQWRTKDTNYAEVPQSVREGAQAPKGILPLGAWPKPQRLPDSRNSRGKLNGTKRSAVHSQTYRLRHRRSPLRHRPKSLKGALESFAAATIAFNPPTGPAAMAYRAMTATRMLRKLRTGSRGLALAAAVRAAHARTPWNVDHKRTALPMAARVAIPLTDVSREVWAPVHHDVPLPALPLAHVVEHRDAAGCLYDSPGAPAERTLRQPKYGQPEGQAAVHRSD